MSRMQSRLIGKLVDTDVDASSALGAYIAKRDAALPSTGVFDNAIATIPRRPRWDLNWDAGCVGYWFADENTTRVSGAASSVPNIVRSGVDPLIMATAGSRPTYNASGWQTQPSLRLDGVDDYMTADACSGYASGSDLAFSLILAVKPVTTYSGVFASFGRSTLDTSYMQVYSGGGNLNLFRKDDSGGAGVFTSAAMTDAPHVIVVSFAGTTISAWIDGTLAVNAVAMNVGACTWDRFTIGALGRSSYSNFAPVDIKLAALFSRALTAAEVARANALVADYCPILGS